MKKGLKVVGIILAVLVLIMTLAVGAFRIFLPEYFKAGVTAVKELGVVGTVKWAKTLIESGKFDSEQYEKNREDNDKQLIDTVNKHGLVLSGEQLDAVNSMELTDEEKEELLTQQLLGTVDVSGMNTNASDTDKGKEQESTGGEPDSIGDADNAKPKDEGSKAENTPEQNAAQDKKPASDTVAPQTNQNPSNTNTQKTEQQGTEQNKNPAAGITDERVARLVARMYVLKSQYTGSVEGIVASMKADYMSLPADQRTTSAKAGIATSYMGQINALEAQCDAQVDAIVTELRQVLKETGGDASLADAIVTAYANEKQATKSYYINRYAD